MPVDEPLHIAFLNIPRAVDLKSEALANFGEERVVAPWVNLLFKKETETSASLDLVHVRLRGEPHDEQRRHVELLAEANLYAQLVARNVVLGILNLNPIGNPIFCDNTIEIMVGVFPCLAVPAVCVARFSRNPLRPSAASNMSSPCRPIACVKSGSNMRRRTSSIVFSSRWTYRCLRLA